MASELTLSAALAFTKSTRTTSKSYFGNTFTVSGTDYVGPFSQTIATTPGEALLLGDITTVGYALIKNKDAANYVTLRATSGGTDVVKLKAGEFCLLRFAAAAPWAVAVGGACELEITLIED